MSETIPPFEAIRRTNPAGNEFWSSRDFAKVLGDADYPRKRNRTADGRRFTQIIKELC